MLQGGCYLLATLFAFKNHKICMIFGQLITGLSISIKSERMSSNQYHNNMKEKGSDVNEQKSTIVPVRQEGSTLLKRQSGLYTISELMSMFGVCRRTISNWQSSGRLSYIKIGGLLYVSQTQLEEFLQDNVVVGYKRFGRMDS
jgi:hypothetical protein